LNDSQKSLVTRNLPEYSYADDPDRRFLRPTDYANVEAELRDLALTKEEETYTLWNLIKVRLLS